MVDIVKPAATGTRGAPPDFNKEIMEDMLQLGATPSRCMCGAKGTPQRAVGAFNSGQETYSL